MWYKLDENNNPVKCSIREYTKWLDENPTRKAVRQEEIGKSYVSTVFLGLDHGYKKGTPVLWETMIFGGKHDQYQERYGSYQEALIGHEEAVKLVKKKSMVYFMVYGLGFLMGALCLSSAELIIEKNKLKKLKKKRDEKTF